ncbi:MAG: L,D-transpeptidase family protein [Clostridia bacterium]|nr:L,D-transpeptidase family protein [Clostridia bacterium]
MKKHICLLLSALCLMPALALAAPELSGVLPGDAALVSGAEGWYFDFAASEGGTLALQLLSGETGEAVYDVGAMQIEAGTGRLAWNGVLPDGTHAAPGDYMAKVQLKNYWGDKSESQVFSLHIFESEAARSENVLDLSALDVQEAKNWDELSIAAEIADEDEVVYAAERNSVPQAASFWEMNPDDYDLTNPEHQQAVWDLMMQPITVLEGEQTENIYITHSPGISARPYKENCAGELHGQSQGVNVLEEDTDGDGYVLIEAYTNDGTKTDNSYMESIAASKVQGYIKKSRLKTVTPSDKYALLVDKLRQKLYVFEGGRIISSLDVSTGLNTKSQPYNETPAGEFLVVSWTGDFKAGSRTIGRFALRINGGTLLHEVLHDVGADGKTKIYDNYEPQLGYKASHGCVRIPRRKNADGINMQWFWDNLEKNTKVFVWEDKGRRMYDPELPEADLPLYRNPDGGRNYHLDASCSGVKDEFLPLTGDFTYGDLDSDAFKKLTPCVYCGAPLKRAELYKRYVASAEQIGAEITDEAKAAFGVE